MSDVWDMRKLPKRHAVVTPFDLFYKLEQKPLLFGTMGKVTLVVASFGFIVLACIAFFFILIIGVLTDSEIVIGILGLLTILALIATVIWAIWSFLRPALTFKMTPSGVEVESDTGSSHRIKWSDIEYTRRSFMWNYDLFLHSGKKVRIADWRTPYVNIFDKVIQNAIFFYANKSVRHGIFEDAKSSLSGRGIAFPMNLDLLANIKRRLWIYCGLFFFGLIAMVPILWYRLITLEVSLWLAGGLALFGFIYIPWAFYKHRIKSRSSDIRLTDTSLITQVHGLEERIPHTAIAHLRLTSNDNYIAMAETSHGVEKISFDEQYGYILLQYLVGELARPIFVARGDYV